MAKAKQEYLDGMKPPSIKAIDKAAEAYVEARNTRMGHTVKEKERKIILLDLMKQNKLTEYLYDGKIVRVTETENIKVNEVDADEGTESE
jgi:hypothetical protein